MKLNHFLYEGVRAKTPYEMFHLIHKIRKDWAINDNKINLMETINQGPEPSHKV